MSAEKNNDQDKVALLVELLESGYELNVAVDQVNSTLADSKQSLLAETEIEKAIELATVEIIRSNEAYLASLKTQLRSASNPSTAVENPPRDTRNQGFPQSSARGKEAVNTQIPPSILIERLDELKKSMEEADRKLKNAVALLNDHIVKRNANPKKMATQQYLNEDCRHADSESHDQSPEELMADEENSSYHPSAKLTEEEKFYRTLNQVADDHSTEIRLGLAYGKYRFWKAIFTSKFGQIVLMLILIGLFWLFGSHKSTEQQAPVLEVQTPIQPSPLKEPAPVQVDGPMPKEMVPASNSVSDTEAPLADHGKGDDGKNTSDAAFTDEGNHYYQPGIGGVGNPVCVYCPDPKYSNEARRAKYEGTIALQAVIASDGTVSDVQVVNGPGIGLNEVAIETVKHWKFKPAPGPDGKPVAVSVPVQISFHLQN